jgi:hypothetical protein
MRTKMIVVIFAVLIVPGMCAAQKIAGPARGSASADQLGMSCAQILDLSSSEWIAKFASVKGSEPAATLRAINVYGKCYDARTDQLAAALGRSGKGPLMGARGNFLSLQKAMDDFKAKALVDSQPPADAVKTAYASLYEKQFRYEFYQSYAPKPATSVGTSAARANSTAPSATAKPTGTAPAGNDASLASDAAKQAARPDPNANDNDPVTLAKNHFGALLGELPDEQMHALHGSFGGILGANAATSRMQLLIYRYAIFLLEPPGEKPFAPPPF